MEKMFNNNTVFDTINKSFAFDNTIIVVVVIVVVVIYLLFTSSKKEGFVDPSGNVITLGNVSSMDDKVAINTLAQISRSLMSGGGLTIPGDVKITGKTTIGGDTNITGKTTIGSDTNITGKTTIGGDTNITGKTTIGGATNISGATNVNGATIDISGNLNVTSITIGGAKLSWNNANNRLVINQDLHVPTKIWSNTIRCENGASISGDLRVDNVSGVSGLFTGHVGIDTIRWRAGQPW
jgi:acyl-[acyl carrier protein]--UDP-N-acetylglucosamine O-acyltransferase